MNESNNFYADRTDTMMNLQTDENMAYKASEISRIINNDHNTRFMPMGRLRTKNYF